MPNGTTRKPKGPKLLCLYVGEEKKADIVKTAAELGFENASAYVRALFEIGGALTRNQMQRIRERAARKGITPAELVAAEAP